MAAVTTPGAYRSRRKVIWGAEAALLGGEAVGHLGLLMWMEEVVVVMMMMVWCCQLSSFEVVGINTATIAGGRATSTTSGPLAAAVWGKLDPRDLLHDGHKLHVLGILPLVLQRYFVPELARISCRRPHID
jgi:hypothetical protein